MDETDFEGSLVLESLAAIGKLEAFFSAIDSDDFSKAKSLMIEADLDEESISIVLKKMTDTDGGH
ncbi:MAG: hypothetical protein KDD33_05305 [Bdellovibrionales bacterium]|nr:hypothetical protein [Bdellovibrionales bacterium]